jgi:uncharacterized protein (TIGR02996 family)
MLRKRGDPARSQGTTRRSFLVSIGGAILGSYFLPSLDSGAGAPVSTDVAEAARRVLSKPLKTKSGNTFSLLWHEETDQGIRVMYWRPETEEEVVEADRFYWDARNFNPKNPTGKRKINAPPRRGPEERALIQAVLDHLDDDAPRLAYADWLNNHGDSLGEFARVSIMSERMDPADPRKAALDDRWSELLERDAEKWFAPLAEIGLRPEIMGNFYPALWLLPYGLIENIEIDKPSVLLERFDHLFAAAPVLHRIQFEYSPLDTRVIAASPHMAQVTSIDLSSLDLTIDDFRALVASPYLVRLKELDFSYNKIGPDGTLALVASGHLGHLETLKLASCALGLEGVKTLVTTPKASRLICLVLSNNQIDEEGIRTISVSTYLRRLRSLDLSGNRLGTEGVRAMCDLPLLRSLQAVALASCDLQADSAAVLASLQLGELTSLNLDSNPLGNEGAKALSTSPHFGKLQSLSMEYCELQDKGLEALAASPNLGRLILWKLSHNEIGPQGVGALAESRFFTELRELDLRDNPIGAAGAKALGNSPHFKKLKKLSVSEQTVGKTGKRALLERFGDDVMSF